MDRPLVLVVDDEKKILELLKSYLEINGYDCFCAQNGKEAINFFMQCHNASNVHTMRTMPNKTISLVLLDLMLPDLSGEEICKKIRALSDVPIIMITAKVDEESIIHGLNIGADDYVCKPFSPKQLMARVKAALRRQSGGANGNTKNSLMIHGDLCVDTEKRSVQKNGVEITLTRNQYKILALLMSRPAKIWTRDEIIDAISDEDFDGFDRAIDSHIKNLRQKIEDDSKNPVYIETVYGMGYRMKQI